MKRLANLRVCASCEWIFRLPSPEGCPKCLFGSYGARYVYGRKAYHYAKTQEPWFRKKMGTYAEGLHREIVESQPQAKPLGFG